MFFINQNNYDLNKNIVAKCLMQQVGLKTKKMFLFFLHENATWRPMTCSSWTLWQNKKHIHHNTAQFYISSKNPAN